MNLQEKSDAEILAIVDPMMDNIVSSSIDFDYEAHIRDFSDRIKTHISKEGFQKVCEECQADLGLFEGRDLVRIFRRPDSIAVIWTQNFSKCSGDYVAEMVVKEENDTIKIDHISIF
ncbi:hypothetical protein [Curvivirga aplysinae]|uniref:hypothetical protein n=1 Tax=Curvivirga aplysinae TaxID=2529852 RepID=UPI0012BBFAC7|nr:hypothetical protein [Curvivirga aplysinae]MTI09907.1 hypothetical protein [Curvivirga aplysinae]